MNIITRDICGKLVEVVFEFDDTTVNTGTLDKQEALDLARLLTSAAHDIIGLANV